MAGIAAEAINFGKAEGGAVDEDSLKNFLTNIQPPWNILRIQVLNKIHFIIYLYMTMLFFIEGASSLGSCSGYFTHSRA